MNTISKLAVDMECDIRINGEKGKIKLSDSVMNQIIDDFSDRYLIPLKNTLDGVVIAAMSDDEILKYNKLKRMHDDYYKIIHCSKEILIAQVMIMRAVADINKIVNDYVLLKDGKPAKVLYDEQVGAFEIIFKKINSISEYFKSLKK